MQRATVYRRLVVLLAVVFGFCFASARASAATRVIWVPTPGTNAYTIGAYAVQGLNLCTPLNPTTGVLTVKPVNGGTATVTPQTFNNNPSCPGVSFSGQATYFQYMATDGVSSGWDYFQVQYTTPIGSVTFDVVIIEGAGILGRRPPSPCKGCEAMNGAVSGPQPGEDDFLDGSSADVSREGLAAVAAPIDVASGNVFYEHTDYTTAGQNPLSFTRYYNSGASRNSYATSFVDISETSHNWRSNFDPTIDVLSSGAVVAERPDGRILPFFLVGSTWTPDSDVDYQLTQSGSTWTLTGPDDTVETYDSVVAGALSGKTATLTSIQARNGYTQTLNYTGAVLTSVTDSYGRSLSFAYNSDATLASVTTPDHTTISYGYTTASGGRILSSATYPTSPAETMSYHYANASLPFALTSVTDENGDTFESWTYDTNGRGATSARGGSLGANAYKVAYPSVGATTTVTNAQGVTDTYTFARRANGVGLPQVTQISRAATSSTAAATKTIAYDANGYMASATDWNGNQTTYTNNAHGLPTSLTEAAGTTAARTVAITYDPKFVHLPATITSAGVTRGYTYDSGGEPLTITLTDTTTTTSPYSTNGQARTWTNTWANFLLATTKTPAGNVTTFGYDSSGALTSITDALNHVTSVTSHTGGGRPLTIVDPNSVTTTLTYDQRQRLLSSTVAMSAGARTTGFAYDKAGNPTKTTLPDGSFLLDGYDAAHRLTKVTDALGNYTSLTLDTLGDVTATNVYDSGGTPQAQHAATFDALGRTLTDVGGRGQTTTLTYDANGNALTVTDGLGHTTTNTFDALDRLSTSTDANSGVTTTTYDAHDRVTAVKDANGNATSYVFDGFGDVIGQTSPDTGTTVFKFDSDGNLTTKTDAAGVVANQGADALDRPTSIAYPADAAQNITFTYDETGTPHGDGIGRLTSVTDAAGAVTLGYDERGGVLLNRRTSSGANHDVVPTYDAAGRPSGVTYPSGLQIAYGRDAQGNINEVDAYPNGSSTASVVATLTNAPFGPVNSISYGNGLKSLIGLDADYAVSNISVSGTAGKLQDLTYTPDAANNITAIADAVNAANSQTLGYDALNRLTSATSGSGGYGSLAWVYDGVGNLKTRTTGGMATTYGYTSGTNQLASITLGSATTAVATNANGNITSIPPAIGGAVATFAYSVANRLASVSGGSATATSYAYGFDGHRITKTDSGSGATTLFAYGLGGELLEEKTGKAVTDYIYANGTLLGTFAPNPAMSAIAGAARSDRRTALLSGDGDRMASAQTRRWLDNAALLSLAGVLLAAIGLHTRRRLAPVLALSALGFLFVSCSCEDNNNPPPSNVADAGHDARVATTDGGQVRDSGTSSMDAANDGRAAMPDSGNGADSATPPTDAGGDSATTTMEGGTVSGGDGGLTALGALYYVHTDHLGTPQLVTDGAQKVVWSATYDPYGTTNDAAGSATQNIRLPGQFFDAETGLHQNGFRDYMPDLGRYLESDPIGLGGGMNPYAYAKGNSLNRTDPLGLVDAEFTFPWDPTYSEDAAFNPSKFYTYAGHGSANNPNVLLPTAESTTGYTVKEVGDYILSHDWDRKKPILAVQCYATRGGRESFAGQLAQYLADAIQAPVTIVGSSDTMRPERWRLPGTNFYYGGPDPGPGGWRTMTMSPTSNQ